ncbi:excisionase [Salmonella enterica subsp. enterica]|uniref:Excisionase n=1 Tax=Salmonella enterica I TaxID=59201 RepID=A0A379WRN1_SALET|nr:excisionase [Salmonella enterica subsp. enterica]
MSNIIQLTPNEWVCESVLIAVTGSNPEPSSGQEKSAGWLGGSISTSRLTGIQNPPVSACITERP